MCSGNKLLDGLSSCTRAAKLVIPSNRGREAEGVYAIDLLGFIPPPGLQGGKLALGFLAPALFLAFIFLCVAVIWKAYPV